MGGCRKKKFKHLFLRATLLYYMMSCKKANAAKFDVPISTPQFRLKNPEIKFRCGPPKILSEDEENMLVKWITECTQKGFPRCREVYKIVSKSFWKKMKDLTFLKITYQENILFESYTFK